MDIYQSITERIVKALRDGVVPWRKTWQTGLPKSLTSQWEYRGINILLLGMPGFSSRYWLTFREAKRLGGFVKKGEKGTGVQYWHWRTEEEITNLRLKLGKENLAPCTLFPSVVFNLDQVQGIERPEDDVPSNDHEPIKAAEALIKEISTPPRILEGATQRPAYCECTDEITMPCRAQFENAEEFYSTLFHELVHATGHSRRLKRLRCSDGEKETRYSFEELVAEFGASFLCGLTGISNEQTIELSAAYIDGWASTFKKDSRMLVKAASAAQKAVDYLRGNEFAEHPGIF